MEQVGLAAWRVLTEARHKMGRPGDAAGRRREVAITDRLGGGGDQAYHAAALSEAWPHKAGEACIPNRASDCA